MAFLILASVILICFMVISLISLSIDIDSDSNTPWHEQLISFVFLCLYETFKGMQFVLKGLFALLIFPFFPLLYLGEICYDWWAGRK